MSAPFVADPITPETAQKEGERERLATKIDIISTFLDKHSILFIFQILL